MGPKIIYHKCDKCGYEENNSCPITTWKCPKCGFSKRKIYHKCNICGYEEYTMSPNWTCKCQKTFICDKCNKEFIYEGDINYFKKKKFHICEACQNKLLGKGKGIYKCNNCGEFIKATNNYNICPHCNKIINKCENGLKIKFCNVCKKETRHNGNICLVCNPSSSTNKYEFLLNNVNEWNKFKYNFENNVKHVFLDDFTCIPTFREQNSTSWGDNGKLFEQYLVDKNIG